MSISIRWTLWLLLPIALVIYIGCESDVQRIREANQTFRASQTKTASLGALTNVAPVPTFDAAPTPLVADISVIDVREGDCITSRLPDGLVFETVQMVACSADWQFRVIGSFAVETTGSFPGDDYFVQQAFVRCDRRYSDHLIPTAESWAQGDRTINCMQGRYGLGLEKLNRLSGTQSLIAGECINEAPETNFEMVELVNCVSDWEFRVLGSFIMEDGPYPGDDYIASQAEIQCDRRYGSIYSPSAESWPAGDRTVICIQDNYGLAITSLERLDRLVGANSVGEGECYNEAPETNFVHVELVDCSGQWEFQVLNSFVVEATGTFPGDDYFDQQASQKCNRTYSHFNYPTEETWLLGDRTVICLQER